MSTLEQLVAGAREQVERRRSEVPEEALRATLTGTGPPGRRGAAFEEAITGHGLAVIAEFKRGSPSAGDIRPGAEVGEIVDAYRRGGAAALSVLTEERRFGGSIDDLRAARQACGLPILRKDFIVDPYQLTEAAAAGADAVLLIVAALDDGDLRRLRDHARGLDLGCLIEVHDRPELERALALEPELVGINNRDLRSFTVDLAVAERLLGDVPEGVGIVAESGYESPEQLVELERRGADAVLIGESLMRSGDPEGTLRGLLAALDSGD